MEETLWKSQENGREYPQEHGETAGDFKGKWQGVPQERAPPWAVGDLTGVKGAYTCYGIQREMVGAPSGKWRKSDWIHKTWQSTLGAPWGTWWKSKENCRACPRGALPKIHKTTKTITNSQNHQNYQKPTESDGRGCPSAADVVGVVFLVVLLDFGRF